MRAVACSRVSSLIRISSLRGSYGLFFLVCLKPSVMKPLYQFCNGQHMRNMWYICVAACAGFDFVRKFRHRVALDSWEGVGTLGHSRVSFTAGIHSARGEGCWRRRRRAGAGLRWAVARAIGDGIARFAHRRKRLRRLRSALPRMLVDELVLLSTFLLFAGAFAPAVEKGAGPR